MCDETRNERIRRLFGDAMELSPAERERFVERACRDDAELAVELRQMLELAENDQGDELGTAVAASIGQVACRPPPIDGYEDFELIGEGGMGSVFRARQLRPVRRTVAIKTVRTGTVSAMGLARFEVERQALARMNHPGIATVYDAGTDADGQPFLVMEFVDGASITEHCRAVRPGLEALLELFAKVCDAIEHAHQRGVLHRDLKPANVLVTRHGTDVQPKVIDFGIAKALAEPLAESGEQTLQGALLGTLDYMSPEQLQGDGRRVDTRSDVYALGVILYELLVGARPLTSNDRAHAGLTGWVRIVQDEVPIRPSRRMGTPGRGPAFGTTDVRRLTAELDWVVMKALEKDPERRYQAPRELGDDIRRFLLHLPVEAGPPSEIYRLRKFVRRHRSWAIGLVTVFALLAAGLVVTTDQANENRELAAREKAARTDAQRTSERLRESLYRSEMRYGADELDATAGLNAMRATVARWLPQPDLPDLRNFEWHLLAAACNQELRIAPAHDGIRRLQWQLDDRLVSTHLGHATVWDANDGSCLQVHELSVPPLGAIALSRDGKVLADLAALDVVRIVEVASGRERARLPHGGHVLHGAFSDDGSVFICVAASASTTVWDTTTGERLFDGPEADGSGYAVARDGSRFAIGRTQPEPQVLVYRRGDSAPLQTLAGAWKTTATLAFDATGTRLAHANCDGWLRVWSVDTGETLLDEPLPDELTCVALDPGGTRVATGGTDSAVYVHDLAGGPVERLRGHEGPVNGLAWSPDGRTLASISEDGTLRWWQPGTRRVRRTRQLMQGVFVDDPQLHFDQGGRRLKVTVGRGFVHAWSIDDGAVQRGLDLGTTDARLLRWQTRDADLPPYRFAEISDENDNLAFSTWNGGRLWLWPAGQQRPTPTELLQIGAIVHVHGNRLLAVDALTGVYLLDATSGRRLALLHPGCDIGAAAAHPHEDLIAVACSDRTIRLWHPDRGVLDELHGHAGNVDAVAFSPDGTRLASGSRDRTVRLWDVAARAEVARLKTEGRIGAVTFSGDGSRLAAFDRRGLAIVWDTRRGGDRGR